MKRGPADRNNVNVGDELEIRHWCKELGCTEAALRAAVGKVGVNAAKVKADLKQGKPSKDA